MNQQSGFIFSVSRYFYERITILKVEIAQKYGVFGKYFCTKNISCLETLFKKATRCYRRFLSSALFEWRAATSSLELILHLRRVVQQKNQFFFFQILDRGQKYLIRVFLQLSNSLKQTIWVSHFGK